MATWRIVCDDVLKWAAEFQGEPFAAILCDPPYHLHGGKGKGGFMNAVWDGSHNISFQKETWVALAEHLLPGGFLFVFASSRGWHRLACALEDAGLIIQPSIFNWRTREAVEVPFCLSWLTGQSFPKATRIDTQIDKAAGKLEERKVVGKYKPPNGKEWNLAQAADSEIDATPGTFTASGRRTLDIERPATDLACAWEGHRYGGQILKDACTPIIVAYKDLTCEPICDTIVETTFLMEVLLCTRSPVQDVESLIPQIHQRLRAVVEGFAQKNADVWVSLKNVNIAGKPSESNQATMTLHDFVVGPALTKDVINQLGVQVGLSAKDMLTSDMTGSILQSIGLLWANILADLLNHGSTFTTSTKINLITDLRILEFYLLETISALTIPVEQSGLQSLVLTVESLLRSLAAKLPLLNDTIATGGAIGQLVERGSDLEANRKAHAKNELSPIIVAQKPWEGKRLDCIVETGAGSLWVDGGRIVCEVGDRTDRIGGTAQKWGTNTYAQDEYSINVKGSNSPAHSQGRWPANFCLIHSPDCKRVGTKRVKGDHKRGQLNIKANLGGYSGNWGSTVHDRYADPDGMETVDDFECVPECPVARLDEQAGYRGQPGGPGQKEKYPGDTGTINFGGDHAQGPLYFDAGEKGGASRFFKQCDWSHEVAERIAGADPAHYCPKAAKRERNQNLDNFYWLIDKRVPIGFIRIDKAKWDDLGEEEERIKAETGKRVSLRAQGNIHGTLKPISLCKHLATLLLPPKEYAPRRILIPFAGTMSEGIGALLAGWDEIVGIDSEQDYCDIGEARMEFWSVKMRETGSANPKTILKKRGMKVVSAQMPLEMHDE